MIYRVHCGKCEAVVEQQAAGAATKYGGSHSEINTENEALSEVQVTILQCRHCNSISLWEIIEQDGKPIPSSCLFKETNDLIKEDYGKYQVADALAKTLNQRAAELNRCWANQAYLSVIIHAGSIVEGLLFHVLDQHHRDPSKKKAVKLCDRSGVLRDREWWKLSDMIDAAHELGYVNDQWYHQAESLRHTRNFVHPHVFASKKATVSEGGARIAAIAANEITDQLKKTLLARVPRVADRRKQRS